MTTLLPIAARLPPELLGAVFLAINRSDRRFLTYSLVCTHWNDVVNCTHALWRVIDIILGGPDVTPAFEKSGHRAQASASVQTSTLGDIFCSSSEPSSNESILHVTHLTLPRPDAPSEIPLLKHITHFTIDRGMDTMQFGMQDYLRIVKEIAPTLQSLTYNGYDTFSYTAFDRLPWSIPVPKLRTLKMWGPSSGFEIVPLLAMPNLEELWLSDDAPFGFAEDWDDGGPYIHVSDDLTAIRARCALLRRVEFVHIRCLKPETYKLFLNERGGDDRLEEVIIHKGTLTDAVLSESTLSPGVKRVELHAVPNVTKAGFRSFIDRALAARADSGRANVHPLEVVYTDCAGMTDFDGEPRAAS